MNRSRLSNLFLGFLCLAPVVLFPFIGCSTARDPWASARPGQKHVLASFAPLYCMAANIAGDHAMVLCLTTAEGPHDYRATHTDAMKIAGEDLYLYNGLGLDDESSKKLMTMTRGDRTRAVAVGDQLSDKLLVHGHEDDPEETKGGGHHHHGDHDPHVWLGLEQARVMVDVVAAELAKLDAEHKADFERNAAAYKTRIDKLQTYGKEKFAGVKNRSIISMHESLAYFAKTFDLNVVGAIMEQAAHAADASTLTRLVKLGTQKNVHVIAIEPQYREGAAQELASALRGKLKNVEVIEIDPVETASPFEGSNPSPDFYLQRMHKNIDVLAEAFRKAQ